MNHFALYLNHIVNDEINSFDKKIRIQTRAEKTNGRNGLIDKGHAIMDAMRSTLNFIDTIMPRSDDQIIIHEKMLPCLCRFVYGEAFDANEAEIMKYNNFVHLKKGSLFTAPRRSGKTEALIVVLMTMFLNIPNVEISCISQSAHAAGSEMGLLGKVRDGLESIFKVEKFRNRNSKHLVKKYADDDIRKIHSFSCGVGDG